MNTKFPALAITLSGILALPLFISDGCVNPIRGCTDPASANYNKEAKEDDGSCIPFTFFATVDGVAFKAAGSTFVTSNSLSIRGTDESTGKQRRIEIILEDITIAAQTYTLNDSYMHKAIYCANCNNSDSETDATHTGTLTLTKVDATNRLVSGTFSCTLNDYTHGGVVTITDGSFNDIKW